MERLTDEYVAGTIKDDVDIQDVINKFDNAELLE